ncbi:hypothetical protein M5J20_06245 [Corynebacterium sp. TA-R-1]|uniref:Uncharacterized protein n=1 Tax=Corynebacterium stercoris TaxID=2943490 RepID=A0ABT1G183_9CORY|nr:hypothetical protein [Corynebacterium stercoris]
MSGTSIRALAALPGEVVGAPETAGQAGGQHRADQIAELRAKMAALGGEVAPRPVEDTGTLAIAGPLSLILPNGGLPRQAVTQVSDTPALVVELIARAVADGGRAGVVGWPELSYAAIEAEGLERVITVPEPGIEDLAVAGVLAEGLDLVVLRARVPLELTPVRARPLLARLRKGNAALACVNVAVPSPALGLSGAITGFHGIGRGTGRITGIDMQVRAERKGMRPASTTVTLGRERAQTSVGKRAKLRAVP